MNSPRMDLGYVAGLMAESFGEPGQRTFRLLAQTGEGSVSLWLEKEQIVMLGSAIDELLERVPSGDEPTTPVVPTFIGELDVRAGALSLGYSREYNGFVLEATEFVSAFDFESISFIASRGQLERVAEQIDAIVAASRPRCLLCGTPLSGEPHFCPQSNGHASVMEEE